VTKRTEEIIDGLLSLSDRIFSHGGVVDEAKRRSRWETWR